MHGKELNFDFFGIDLLGQTKGEKNTGEKRVFIG